MDNRSHIYFDNSATTKVRAEVIDAMMPYLHEVFGNPSSLHAAGREAKKAILTAREQVAALLNCSENEVFFSPCGTVSNNVAIMGRARFVEANGGVKHLITTNIEHPSVFGPAQYLESSGWKVTYLPVDKEGFVSPEQVKAALTHETSIVSIMWANNEIGTVEPIDEIADLIVQANQSGKQQIFFHTDAVQVPGKIKLDLSAKKISALSLSGHKFYAPKGIGILYLQEGQNCMPIMFGGGQEMGLLPGTEGLSNIVAIGKAAQLAHAEVDEACQRLRLIQNVLIKRLLTVPGLRVTGAQDVNKRLPGHVSISVPGLSGESLVLKSDLKGVCVSSGSACHQGVIEPSHVLKSLGLSNKEALGAVRISAGRFNTMEEAEQAADMFVELFKGALQAAG